MLTRYPHAELGRFENDWLSARYHFSFSAYHNPARMGFGNLRVLNDDRVRAGQGFGFHPHRDMEIITYVRSGAIHHRDNLGNHGITAAGDVQVMSAGTGIVHAEHSDASEDTTLFQIWIEPNARGVKPRWDSAEFPKHFVTDALPLLVSGRAADKDSGTLFIHADAAVFGGRMAAGTEISQAISRQAYLVVSRGRVMAGGQELAAGDGAECVDEPRLQLRAVEDCDMVVVDIG